MSVPAMQVNDSIKFDELKKQVFRLVQYLDVANHAIETIEYVIDPEALTEGQLFEYRTFRKLFDQMVDLEWELNYMQKPIIVDGYLYLNDIGRWQIGTLYEITCGSIIEVQIKDSITGSPRWVRTSVEGDDGQYYLVGYKDVSMAGLRARIRGGC